jgi:hypothetical protein
LALPRKFFQLIPGVLLLVVLGYAAKITEQSIARYGKAQHLVLPNIEYVLWAILFGLCGLEHRRRPASVSSRHCNLRILA